MIGRNLGYKALVLSVFIFTGSLSAQEPGLPPLPEYRVAPEDNNWREVKSYEGRFRILAPCELTEKLDSVQTAVGRIAYHTFICQPEEKEADNLIYMLSYCDYPPNTMHSDSLELLDDFFAATTESAVSSMRGELRYSDVISLQDYPGRIWRIDYLNEQAVIKTRAFLAGRRFYSIQTITLRKRSLNASSDKFMDSFRIIE